MSTAARAVPIGAEGTTAKLVAQYTRNELYAAGKAFEARPRAHPRLNGLHRTAGVTRSNWYCSRRRAACPTCCRCAMGVWSVPHSRSTADRLSRWRLTLL